MGFFCHFYCKNLQKWPIFFTNFRYLYFRCLSTDLDEILTINVESNFVGTRSLKKSQPQPFSRESAMNQKVKQCSENDSKQRSLQFFSLPLYTAVHSSSLCSALSAATIRCFFSAAVYYRPKNEAKDLVLVNKFESRNPCVMPWWKQKRWQFHSPLLPVTQLRISVKIYPVYMRRI